MVSPALLGLDTATVEVEMDVRPGLPGFSMVGLPDAAVQEARERVRSGVVNPAFARPALRIVPSLSPVHLRTAGPQYDLPVALTILSPSGQVRPGVLAGAGALGELALDGALRPVAGALAMAEHAARRGWRRLPGPHENAGEASLVPGIQVLGARTLRDAVDILEQRAQPAGQRVDAADLLATTDPGSYADPADVRGQGDARRALEVAAAGSHSLLMIGPSGGGTTMLARRLPGSMPALAVYEALALTPVHSAAGLLAPGQALLTQRPCRAPHHTLSVPGRVRGRRGPRPGKITLAHPGVLFLDEVCAFAPAALDALRQPLEEDSIHITHARGTAPFPAEPLLVCAGNPCPCGRAGDPQRAWACAPAAAEAYRIDLQVDMPRLHRQEMLDDRAQREGSAAVRARVQGARAARRDRGQGVPNARMGASRAREVADLDRRRAGGAGARAGGSGPAGGGVRPAARPGGGGPGGARDGRAGGP